MSFYKVYLVKENGTKGKVVNVYANNYPTAKKLALKQEVGYKLY